MNRFGTPDFYLKQCESFDRDGFQARFYQTAELAVYDLVQSLIHLMPHKNKVAIVNVGTYLVDIVISVALKNQQQIVYKKPDENIMTFIDGLDASTHFVFWTNQHQFTSDIFYSQTQIAEILDACHRKKVYSMCIAGFDVGPYLEKVSQKEQVQYSTFIQRSSIFERTQNPVPLYFSAKLKVPLLVSLYQSNFNIDQNLNQFFEANTTYQAQLTSALEIKQHLKLTDKQALTLSEMPFWTTDKWSLWWGELKTENYIRDTLFISSDFVNKNPDYIKQFKQVEMEIKKKSIWKIA